MSLRCLKCDGSVISVPNGAGFHCHGCGSAFLDFGRVAPDKDLDLARHASEPTAYRCPVDREPLRRYRINGLEFERCPACRHLWLDQGELSLLRRLAADRKPSRSRHPGQEESLFERLDGTNAADLVDLFFEIIGAVADW